VKKIALLFAVCALGLTASAQTKKIVPPVKGQEWWESFEGCRDATSFIPYYPRTSTTRKAPAGLIFGGLPREACVLMPLPEIDGKNGWVRQQAGAPYYFQNVNGVLGPKSRKECLNDAVRVEYLPDKPAPKLADPPPSLPARDENVNVNVTGVPSDINLHGKVDVYNHHDGTVVVEIRNPSVVALPQPPSGGVKRHWWSGKKIVAALAIAGGVIVAIIFATHHHDQPAPPTNTKPPVVTTLPPS
jgi:hypothetical protein